MATKNIEEIDLYALLDIKTTATESEIKKAYRKKALQCHPDKNPDDPKAAESFHVLTQALEILTDTSARTAYDKVFKAKEAAKLRHQELDSKRQKLKEDLERREREAEKRKNKTSNLTDEQKLLAEIERLRKEGNKLVTEEQQKMKEEIRRTLNSLKDQAWDSSLNRIKMKWKADKTDPTNGGYNEGTLRKFLKKYGNIVAIIISPKKKGSALVEFATKEAAEMALEFEKGLPHNPLDLKWLNERPIMVPKKNVVGPSVISHRDYESLVLTKMRQAAERQKLIADILNQELNNK